MIDPTPDNATRLLAALLDAGLGTASLLTPEELLANEITVFNDFVRVDAQTSTPGLKFEKAWERRATMIYQKQAFYVVALPDLLASERAAGRSKDIEDVRILQAIAPPDELE